MHSEFLKTYNIVFNENGEIKACGREACKKLISIANEIDNTMDFGNVDTGFMNIKNLKALFEKVNK